MKARDQNDWSVAPLGQNYIAVVLTSSFWMLIALFNTSVF